MIFTLLFLALHAAPSPPVQPNPLAALSIYSGSWTITGPSTMAGAGKPDHLVNHCFLADAFYTCEQVVNGKPLALIVFTPGDAPNTFHSQIILPDGHATGRGDITRDGDHWTWGGKPISEAGKSPIWYRTENYFTGRDHIRFEQLESTDGVTWQKKSSGEEQRVIELP